MITIQNLGVEFSARPLFSGFSAVINDTDKIALVGKNGAGKSTILKILAGLQSPTVGTVGHPSDYSIGYLPQHMEVDDHGTVMEEVQKVFSKSLSRQQEIERINNSLASRQDYESPEYSALIDRLTYLNERLEVEGTQHMEAEMERTLLGLGFNRTDFDRPTSEFSGGWRMRIELAKILLQKPDLLLLDEPTNHLDIESIAWVEQFLTTRSKAVVLVSHDRAFIDAVTTRTIELNCGRAYDYKVKYSQFLQLRAERVEQQRRSWENQQKQIADIKDFIERFRYKPTKSNQVQSRIKQLEKIVPIDIDEVDTSSLKLKFPPAPRSGDFPLILEDVGKTYGKHTVFSNASFTVRRGEKVAFVGKNGEGKSTLVKCIMGQIPYDGNLKIGHNISIGYFAQNQAQLLNEDLTVFDTIDRVATGDMRTRVRDILGAFMFGGEAADKKVKVLSGGERTRLAMIKLLLQPVNLLILDEPTNHLDIRTKEVLKEAIAAFDGTVILVSHDRWFLDGLVEKVYEFGHGKVTEHLGGIYDFLYKKNFSSLKDIEKKIPSQQPSENKSHKQESQKREDVPRRPSLSYAEQKEQQRLLKRAQKEVKEAEQRIACIEARQRELENILSQGKADPELLEEYAGMQKKLENEMSVWELAQSSLDEIESNDRKI